MKSLPPQLSTHEASSAAPSPTHTLSPALISLLSQLCVNDCVPRGERWHWLMQGHRCSTLCPLVATGRTFSQKQSVLTSRLSWRFCIYSVFPTPKAWRASSSSRENTCAEERHPYQKQAPSREAAALKSYAGQQCDHFKLQLVQNSRPS